MMFSNSADDAAACMGIWHRCHVHFWQAFGRGDMRRGNGIDAQAALDFAR
jgi:hypothetical protein